MAKTTLTREVLPNGKIRLSSPYGIVDTRSEQIYSVVICAPRFEKFFIENVG